RRTRTRTRVRARARAGKPWSSRPHSARAAREEVAQRFDERAARLDFDGIDAELQKELAPCVRELLHRLAVVGTYSRIRRVDDDALAALEILERGKPNVGHLDVARIDEHDRDDVVLARRDRERALVALGEKVADDERDAAASRDPNERLECRLQIG